MHVVFLSALYPPYVRGGAELSTHYLAKALLERGHTVHVFAHGERREEGQVDGVPVVRLPSRLTAKPLFERWHSRRAARVLGRELAQYRSRVGAPDVIHAHDFRSALALSELPLLPTVVTARDYAQICGTTNAILWNGQRCTCSVRDVLKTHRVVEAPWWRKPFRAWQYWYNIGYRKQTFRHFPAQIFISHAQEREIRLQQDLSGVRTTVIYNPVSEDYFADTVSPGTPGSVVYIGTVEMYKGVELLLDAWARLCEQLPHVHLKIVGEGAQRREYERLVERRGLQYRVTFVGRVPHDRLQRVYDEAAVVVAPHVWIEPFGRTVAEALARGRVVVTARSGGPSELVEHGTTGLLFEPGSVDDLSAQLHTALTFRPGEARVIQEAARSWAREHLVSSSIVRQHELFYETVLTRS